MDNILTIAGWAQPADALSALFPFDCTDFDYSDYLPDDSVFTALQAYQHMAHIIAWSQGGQLAVRAIARGVLRPQKLTLLAAPVCFVRRDNAAIKPAVFDAMEPALYQQFYDNYVADPARTKRRFAQLIAKGDSRQQAVMDALRDHESTEETMRWQPWLADLKMQDLRNLSQIDDEVHVQIIHGEADAIVPISQSEMMLQRFTRARLHRWENCAHAPHLHNSAKFLRMLQQHHGL
jgi:pimeloyl-ACP methyl ester carboxylesterase